jgi:micrococcal nuclease
VGRVAFLSVVLVTLIAGCGAEPQTDSAASEEATVLFVIDGDTVEISLLGQTERLRLVGIDAPELDECGYEEARSLLADLVEGADVRLERDVSDRDRFGRLLRFVWVGDVLVNEALVREGVAIARRFPPDTTLSSRLEAAQAEAQSSARGLWSGDLCGPAAIASLEVSAINFDAPGDDNLNLNGEWIEISNVGAAPVDLTGWAVKDESSTNRYLFPPGFEVNPGVTVRLHSGCGADSATALYWCSPGVAVWNNSGDTAFLLDPAGNIAASRSG